MLFISGTPCGATLVFNYNHLSVPMLTDNDGNSDANEVESLPMNDSSGNDVIRVTEPRRSYRISRAPSWHHGYAMSVNVAKNCSTAHPISKFLSYSHLFNSFKNFATSVSRVIVPVFYHEAFKDVNNVNTMKDEIASLENNNTWSIVHLPVNKNLVVQISI